MTNEEIYSTWAPEESLWSTWAKPVLFAHLGRSSELPPSSNYPSSGGLWDGTWAPAVEEKTAIILDLPCDEGVWAGLALAQRGYRPVPLYNAIPLPFGIPILEPQSQRPLAIVNVLPIVGALRLGADSLASLSIPPQAPPVFLLDANRSGNGENIDPGQFDNRSICFTTDFPSATFLISHGISRILLVQRNRIEPQRDLTHILRRWQEDGLILEGLRIEAPSEREPLYVPRPTWYGAMFQRAIAAFGFRRASAGGFGDWMPESSAGG